MDAFLFSLCFAFAAAATAAHPPRPLRQLLTWAITGNLCSLMPSEGRIRGPSSATDGLRVPPINKSSCGAVYSSGHFLLRPLCPPASFLSSPLLRSHLISFLPSSSFLSSLFCLLLFPFLSIYLSSPLTCPFCSPPSSLPSFFFSFLATLLVSSIHSFSLSFHSSYFLPFPFHSPLLSFVLYPLCPPFFLFFPLHSFCFFCSHLILSLLLSSPLLSIPVLDALLPPPPFSYLLFTPHLSFFLSFPFLLSSPVDMDAAFC